MKIIVIGSDIFSKSIIEYLMRRKIKINGIIGKKVHHLTQIISTL